ncbi:hypothetical protein UA08_03120 [Talaromyces atroroseus]|uniref:gamma-glutamylcyclotransferase n=1 Tax=Talaromyces atroroseus TaxID=1441469 RepID=A0A225B252_TALAT|nr:hypothetical protein UA08_03120 [Talaromyces atroroseus]OKL60905.1 hypothetical protein UA08_03120 [Talaromyces atroroseus]
MAEEIPTEFRPRPDTESRPLYFAYGSNLSYGQMRQRCTHAPGHSATPRALARLDGWKWIICDRGYANVIPPAELRIGEFQRVWADSPATEKGDTVYGLLYDMAVEDEMLLDRYEDVDYAAPVGKEDKVALSMRPRKQGRGDYTKWYVPAVVEQWFGKEKGPDVTTVLVYIDEECVREGRPRDEYIARMNRGIVEAQSLGLPTAWTDDVLRKFIPKRPIDV